MAHSHSVYVGVWLFNAVYGLCFDITVQAQSCTFVALKSATRDAVEQEAAQETKDLRVSLFGINSPGNGHTIHSSS